MLLVSGNVLGLLAIRPQANLCIFSYIFKNFLIIPSVYFCHCGGC